MSSTGEKNVRIPCRIDNIVPVCWCIATFSSWTKQEICCTRKISQIFSRQRQLNDDQEHINTTTMRYFPEWKATFIQKCFVQRENRVTKFGVFLLNLFQNSNFFPILKGKLKQFSSHIFYYCFKYMWNMLNPNGFCENSISRSDFIDFTKKINTIFPYTLRWIVNKCDSVRKMFAGLGQIGNRLAIKGIGFKYFLKWHRLYRNPLEISSIDIKTAILTQKWIKLWKNMYSLWVGISKKANSRWEIKALSAYLCW